MNGTYMGCIRDLFINKKILNCYITAGYPDIKTFKDILITLSQKGVDIIEIGIPFSDPIADGDVIQNATIKVLQNRINIEKIGQVLKSIKTKIKSKIIFMSYYNPIYVYGEEKFIRLAKECGVAGVIVPDLPCDEGKQFYRLCQKNNLETILLITSVTPLSRIKEIAKFTTGFLYFVSILGTTGIRNKIPHEIINNLKIIKKNISLPVCLGFGIKSKESIKPFYPYIDGVIVGSALIDIIRKNLDSKKRLKKGIVHFISDLKQGLKF